MPSANGISASIAAKLGSVRDGRLPTGRSGAFDAVPWKPLITLFVSSRFTIWLAGYLGGRAFGAGAIDPVYLCRHDCLWYMALATNGYQSVPEGVPPGSANWAFLPLYPVMVRALSGFVSIPAVAAGLIVSNLAFGLALAVFYLYCRQSVGTGHRRALYACTLLCYSPGTVYFMAPYTESLFLLLSVLTFYLAAGERWRFAGMAGAFLSATRAVGILVVVSLLVMALRKQGWLGLLQSEYRRPRVLVALAVTPLGLAGFMVYLYLHIGDALAFQHVQVAWGREFGNPLRILWRGLQDPGHVHFWYALVTSAALSVVVLGVFHRRYAESVLLALGVLVPLSSFLFSMPRYVFSLFPLYMIVGLHLTGGLVGRLVLLGMSVATACIYAIAWALDLAFVC